MRRAALLLTLVAIAACSSKQKTEAPKPTASDTTAQQDTWVAQGSDLSPEQVRTVQRALADRGFPVELSGKYDDSTRTALNDFQRSRGLPETGNLNADTATALGIDPNEVMPVRGAGTAAGVQEQNPAVSDQGPHDTTGTTGTTRGSAAGGQSDTAGGTTGSAPADTGTGTGTMGSGTTEPSPQGADQTGTPYGAGEPGSQEPNDATRSQDAAPQK